MWCPLSCAHSQLPFALFVAALACVRACTFACTQTRTHSFSTCPRSCCMAPARARMPACAVGHDLQTRRASATSCNAPPLHMECTACCAADMRTALLQRVHSTPHGCTLAARARGTALTCAALHSSARRSWSVGQRLPCQYTPLPPLSPTLEAPQAPCTQLPRLPMLDTRRATAGSSPRASSPPRLSSTS